MKRNIVSVIGMIAGFMVLIISITMSGNINNFVSISSLLITLVGSFCALLVSFPLKNLLKIPSMLKLLLVSPQDNRKDLVILFTDLSRKARKDGLLALEDDINSIKDDFLVSGLQMVVDGVEPDAIREIMMLKLETAERRHGGGQEIFLKWGELAPAFGMLGTLIGLVVMLADLNDAANIGTGMATALITTFYGSLFANLVFLPIASNLKVQTEEEMFTRQMVIEGIIEIQAGTNPRILEEKLMTYLSPDEQKVIKEEKAGDREAESNE